MMTRLVQGGILVALIGIGGLLYSIRKQMNTPPAPPAQSVQPATAANAPLPASQAPQGQEVAGLAPPAVPARPAPAPARRTYTTIPRQHTSRPAVAPEEANATPPAPAPTYVPAPQPEPPAPPPAPAARTLTVPAGTALTVRLLDGISTERNRPGDTFQATLEEPLVVDGVVVADRNANVMGRVVQAQQSGRVAGLAELALELDHIQTVGGDMQIASDTMMRQAEASRGRDAATVGVMAGIGAAIGAIAGGRKGAGIGAAAGGASGAGTVMATRGKPVRFDPETRLTFRLRAPLTVVVDNSRARYAEDNGRPRMQHRQ